MEISDLEVDNFPSGIAALNEFLILCVIQNLEQRKSELEFSVRLMLTDIN